MAGKGRPRKPRDQKIIQGTFREDRNPPREPEPQKVAEIPKAPTYLGRYGKRQWKLLAQDLIEAGILTVVDLATLELCCAAYQQFREAHDAIFRPVDPASGRKTKRTMAEYLRGRNSQTMPEYTVMRSGYQTYKAYMAEFGLSPAARNRISLPPAKRGAADPMEALLDAE